MTPEAYLARVQAVLPAVRERVHMQNTCDVSRMKPGTPSRPLASFVPCNPRVTAAMNSTRALLSSGH